MSESGPQIENQQGTSGYADGDAGHARHRPRWLIGLFVAVSVLTIVAVAAYFVFDRELFQRPFLIVAVVIAWLGALVGISIGNESG